jgi:hypothetical protein
MADGGRRIPVAAIAGGLFCLMLIYLALQVRAGADPAIGDGPSAAAAPAPRQVIVRRVIVRRIVEEDAPATAEPSAGAGTAAPEPAAPAAPPPPAPEPAPVVSQGS